MSGERVIVDRQFFAALIRDAAVALSERSKSSELFAAPLAARARDLLRIRLGNPDANIVGAFFGPILFPNLPPEQHSLLKFRQFLESFPELLEVQRLPVGGDKVKLLGPDKLNSVQNSHLVPTSPALPSPAKGPPIAYLIIDSASFLASLHVILAGDKPSPKTLPNWEQLRKYLQHQFPASEWKSPFIMAVPGNQSDGAESFKGYLQTVGFAVISLAFDSKPSEMEQIIKERSRVSALATNKLLSHIAANRVDAHIFIVTHAGEVASALNNVLEGKRDNRKIAVIGFPEHMDASLLELKENGLMVIDIESDAKIFKTLLPRQRLISINDFDPSKFL